MNPGNSYDLIVVGGGAAGFFAAAHLKTQQPNARILIIEKQKEVLQKVKISGGGRCNVTHACFEPKVLATNYPRGHKELIGPFYKFGPADTIAWFREKGVALKTEPDGRIFPTTDQSQTIIDALLQHSLQKGVELLSRTEVTALFPKHNQWEVVAANRVYQGRAVLWATGNSPKSWKIPVGLGHKIIPPVPSLFTFNSNDPVIKDLAGIATEVKLTVVGAKFVQSGPMLFTHWGLSGPAVLKLSAFAAKHLAELEYQFQVRINWLKDYTEEQAMNALITLKNQRAKQKIAQSKSFDLPARLWERLVWLSGIPSEKTWADLDKKALRSLAGQLCGYLIEINGKSTFKEEFVTSGGLDRKEIDFKNFESKLHPGLYFAGETIDIDAVTGGFNFQNAWTGAYLAAEDIAMKLKLN